MMPTKTPVAALGLAVGGFFLASMANAATTDELRNRYVSTCVAHTKVNDVLAPDDQRIKFCDCRFNYLNSRLKPGDIEDLIELTKAQTSRSLTPEVSPNARASDDAGATECLPSRAR